MSAGPLGTLAQP